MAEQKQKIEGRAFSNKEKTKKEFVKKNPQTPEVDTRGKIIRIMQKDIEGGMKLYPGLTKIKGISWSLSNAVCRKLGFDKNRKIESLSEVEIKKLEVLSDNFSNGQIIVPARIRTADRKVFALDRNFAAFRSCILSRLNYRDLINSLFFSFLKPFIQSFINPHF